MRNIESIWSPKARNLIVATCPKGMAPILASEAEALGLTVSGATETGIAVEGSMQEAMRMNLHLRTAHRVLWQLGEGQARNPDELHQRLASWPWERWIPVQGRLCSTASGQSASNDDPRFVALKTKDAIVDRLKHVQGRRPDSGPERDHTVIHTHWEGRFFSVYLDTSGEPLSHRGYRLQAYKAPMRETLAAACLLGAAWDPSTALVNPMCGAGTLAIEAALMASKTPPGFLRRNFGFMHVVGYIDSLWQVLRTRESAKRLTRPDRIRIIATDHDPKAVKAAEANASRAGMSSWIEYATCDFRDTRLPPPPGLLLFNPEYGDRLGAETDLAPYYKAIGDFMKHEARGYTGAVFTGNADMVKAIGLKPRTRMTLYNGPIESRLLVYDLYEGTRRDRRLRTGGRSSPTRQDNAGE